MLQKAQSLKVKVFFKKNRNGEEIIYLRKIRINWPLGLIGHFCFEFLSNQVQEQILHSKYIFGLLMRKYFLAKLDS